MPSGFPAVTNKEISQIIKQAVPEIHKEGDEVPFGRFNRSCFVFVRLEFIDETGGNFF